MGFDLFPPSMIAPGRVDIVVVAVGPVDPVHRPFEHGCRDLSHDEIAAQQADLFGQVEGVGAHGQEDGQREEEKRSHGVG